MERTIPLETVPLFEGVAPETLGTMLECLGAFRRTFTKGEFLLLAAETVRCVGVVLSGRVHMVQEDREGNLSILAVMAPGELVGETFVCGTHQTATVSFQAAASSEILFLPFDRVLRTCSNACAFQPRLVENMVRVIADKNLQLLERAKITAKRTLREKILAYLAWLDQWQKGPYIVSAMSRTELADYLCADRSALTRELSRMRADGVIDYEKNTYRLL